MDEVVTVESDGEDDGIDYETLANSSFANSTVSKSSKTSASTTAKNTSKENKTEEPTPTDEDKPTIGVRLHRTDITGKAHFTQEEIDTVMACIAEIDPDASLLPYNANEKQKIGVHEYKGLAHSNFATFFNIRSNHWGHAPEGKLRTVMSFI